MFSESDVKSMFDVSEEEQGTENLDRLHDEQTHKHWSKLALSVKFLDARFRYILDSKLKLDLFSHQ